MLMGSFLAASKPLFLSLLPFLPTLRPCFVPSLFFCAYLPTPAVAPRALNPTAAVVLRCSLSPLSLCLLLHPSPSSSGTLFLSVELDEWSRWTVSGASSTGCGRPLLAASHRRVFLFISLFISLFFQFEPAFRAAYMSANPFSNWSPSKWILARKVGERRTLKVY